MNKTWNIEKMKEDGTKLEIRVYFLDRGFCISDVGVKPKGKRKFNFICGTDMTNDYSYRRLNDEDRRKYRMEKILEVCPPELLQEAVNEAWMSLKPSEVIFW